MSLEIRQVIKSHGRLKGSSNAAPVLNRIDLKVAPGDVIGITGPSGVGKTTLGLILAGISRPDQGRVIFNGTDLWGADKASRRGINRKLQMVFQHPEGTFDPRWTLVQSMSEPYRIYGLRPDAAALARSLAEVDLDASLLTRRPHQLSGGELQRLAIARVMSLHPKIVVLDEPTAMLDVLTQARIMALLERFRRKSEVGYVLVSHDTTLLHRFCHQVYRLENGRIQGLPPHQINP